MKYNSLKKYIVEAEEQFDDIYVYDWYIANFPEDTIGQEMFEYAKDLTWDELINSYNNNSPVIEWNDSCIREEVFSELSRRLGVTFDDIYDKWMDGNF